jgi:16S rRNA (adenine1518-N6/adenine1519-N6)-dimethyltransferase
VEADALSGPRALSSALLEHLSSCSRLVANLPYNIASPLLANLLGQDRGPGHMVVTIQQEAADRLLAKPSTRDYSPLSVLVALCAVGRQLRGIPPAAFWPQPRVASALLSLERRNDRPQAHVLQALASFLPAAFHNRRKTLVNSLAEAFDRPAADVARSLALTEKSKNWRAEAFEPVQLSDLALQWAPSASSGRNRS